MGTNARSVGPFTQAVAGELRAQRARLRMTVSLLAERSGVPRSTLSKILSGSRAIDLDEVDGLCRALGMSPADLFDRVHRRIGAGSRFDEEDSAGFAHDAVDRNGESRRLDQGGVIPLPTEDPERERRIRAYLDAGLVAADDLPEGTTIEQEQEETQRST